LFIILANRILRKKSNNRAEKILAIALTSFFFNSTLQSAIISPITTLVSNLQKLFFATYNYENIDTNNLSSSEIDNVLYKYQLNENTISIDQMLTYYPLSRLISAISLSILIYFLILYVKKNIPTEINQEATPFAKKSAIILNSIITCTLILSLFLVISVCITIPYLNEISKPTAFTIARLEATLNDNSSKDSLKLIETIVNPFPEQPLEKLILSDSLKVIYEKLNSQQKELITQKINSFEKNYKLYNSERSLVIKSLTDFKNNFTSNENSYKKNILVNFENETQSIMVDKGDLFQSSVENFSYFVQRQKESFENTLQMLNYSDNFNYETTQNAIDQIKNEIKVTGNSRLDSSYILQNYYNPHLSSYQSNLAKPDLYLYLSADVRDGSEWGFFGFLANPLIRTQSSELVLLMGMFGFGLLGASLLSFQQLSNNGDFVETFKTKPLIINFGNVLARGVGAALVIYLATKGGLSIFSASSTTDANGYILLLTCFVGAVFSEKVWIKIQKSIIPDEVKNPIPPIPPAPAPPLK
tara:strand:- start:1797 stop:3386 length:1590 start_codon:yes stop_codon:yes gene_type:complete